MQNLVFGFYDVLVKGKLNKNIDISYLKDLKELSIKKNINLYLVTGLKKEIAKPILEKYNLFDYFKKENIVYISNEYLSSLSDLDIKLREEKYKSNPNYYDEYLKIYFIKNNFLLNNKKTLFVGHDLWSDAYYVAKYTNSNVVLLKPTLSFNNKIYKNKIKTLHVIDPTFENFKEYLLTTKIFDYSTLLDFAEKRLFDQIMGNLNLSEVNFSKIIKKR